MHAKTFWDILDAYKKVEHSPSLAEEFRNQQIRFIEEYADGKICVPFAAMVGFLDYLLFFDMQRINARYRTQKVPSRDNHLAEEFHNRIFKSAYTRLLAHYMENGGQSLSIKGMLWCKVR